MRVLPNGNLLVASRADRPIREVDGAGNVVRSWLPPASPDAFQSFLTALTLVDGGRRAWYSMGSRIPECTSRMLEVDLETGTTRALFEAGIDEPTSIAPLNAWTAATSFKRRRAVW